MCAPVDWIARSRFFACAPPPLTELPSTAGMELHNSRLLPRCASASPVTAARCHCRTMVVSTSTHSSDVDDIGEARATNSIVRDDVATKHRKGNGVCASSHDVLDTRARVSRQSPATRRPGERTTLAAAPCSLAAPGAFVNTGPASSTPSERPSAVADHRSAAFPGRPSTTTLSMRSLHAKP